MKKKDDCFSLSPEHVLINVFLISQKTQSIYLYTLA